MIFRKFFGKKKDNLYISGTAPFDLKKKKTPKALILELKRQNEFLERAKDSLQSQLDSEKEKNEKLEMQNSELKKMIDVKKEELRKKEEKIGLLNKNNERLTQENMSLLRRQSDAQTKSKVANIRPTQLEPTLQNKKQGALPLKAKNLKVKRDQRFSPAFGLENRSSMFSGRKTTEDFRNFRTNTTASILDKDGASLSNIHSSIDQKNRPVSKKKLSHNTILPGELLFAPPKLTVLEPTTFNKNSIAKTVPSLIPSFTKYNEDCNLSTFFQKSPVRKPEKEKHLISLKERALKFQDTKPMKPHLFSQDFFTPMNLEIKKGIPFSGSMTSSNQQQPFSRKRPSSKNTGTFEAEDPLFYPEKNEFIRTTSRRLREKSPNSKDCLPPLEDYKKFRLNRRIDSLTREKETLMFENLNLKGEVQKKARSLSRKASQLREANFLIEEQTQNLRKVSKEREALEEENHKKNIELRLKSQEIESMIKVCEICCQEVIHIGFESCPHKLCERCFCRIIIEKKPCPYCKRKIIHPHRINDPHKIN